jgi:parvulin-like peptidyl-prolyl isomerase
MTEAASQTTTQILEKIRPAEIAEITDIAIANHLRHTFKMADFVAFAEQDAKVINTCEALGIIINDEEIQAAGDAFRLKHQLLRSSETLAWLERQRINAEDWTQGIRIQLLTQKLKDYLFADSIDSHYLTNREEYHRAAFSQILVSELTVALQIVQTLRAGTASFCAMALEHSQAQPSGKQGGFVGVRFLSTLMPEIREAIAGVQEGEIINPVKTHRGYHILRIEKWFAPTLSESVRAEFLDVLFQTWLSAKAD